MENIKVVDLFDFPDVLTANEAIRLLPRKPSDSFYRERTDRNIGWITKEEQLMLRNSVVGIAGCGGMGGLIAATLVRSGVGEVRIADREEFDVSNLNRQFGASRSTVGKSKALETARLLRDISDDSTVVVYPQGIGEETVESFLSGCNLIFDEIEFYAIGARVLLHKLAREQNITLLNCNTVGHRTFCFKYVRDSMTVEDALGLTHAQAKELEDLMRTEPASPMGRSAALEIERRIMQVFVPEVPEYCNPESSHSTRQEFIRRLKEERRVSIMATNPVMASGFAANRGLAELLETASPGKRKIQELPVMPGYLSFDAFLMQAVTCDKQWW